MDIEYGIFPVHCPACGRKGRWSFVPKTPWLEQPIAYALTENDKAMLHRYCILID